MTTPLDISESQHARFSCSSNLRAQSLTASHQLAVQIATMVPLVTGTK